MSFTSASGEGFTARTVSVPDTGIVTLDFELAGAAVSGIVVDADTGAPLPDVFLQLTRLGGRGDHGAQGRRGADGRFAIAAEEGGHVLAAELLGRVRVVRRLRVGPEGLAEVRLEMGRGLSIAGRVVDPSGRPAPGLAVIAIGSDGFERAVVQSDGAFRLQGLGEGPYALRVGTTLVGFAIRDAVMPGPEPVLLSLRPAGKVALRGVSSEGQPVAEALALIVAVDDAPVDLRGSIAPPTDEDGWAELGSPVGVVAVSVSGLAGAGIGTVDVRSGETSTLEVTLSAPQPAP